MTVIVTKNSSTAAAVPTTSDLVKGELAVNVTDKRIFTENASTAIVELGTNPSTITTTTATVSGTLTANGTFASSNAVVTGGTINSTPIGATTASTVRGSTVTATAGFVGGLTGNVVGNVTGNVTGNITGVVTGNVTGNVTGDVTGNVTASSGTSTFTNVTINGGLDMNAGTSATITNLSSPTNTNDAATKGYVDTADATKLNLSGGTMSGAIAMGAAKITGLADPTAAQDAATKIYVDNSVQGLDAKASCRAGTTANITLSGAQTIDGVSVVAGDRVLVKDQTSSAENGIYVAAASGWARSADANTWDELVNAYSFVEDGTANANNGFVASIVAGGTLGSTAVTWVQFSGAGQVIAGAGMTKSGNTLDVNTAASSRIVVNADNIDLATSGVSEGTYKSVTTDAYGRVTGGTNPTTISGFGITDAYTKSEIDTSLNAKLNLSGGTMSGAVAMGTNKITGMGDPTAAQDATTKTYVDGILGSATSAASSASAAATSASEASTSASNSAGSATTSANSASASASSASQAASTYDDFDDRYLGDKASDPTLDNDGNALLTGALYFNTASDKMKVYSGSSWGDVAPTATSVTVSQISDYNGTATELNYTDGVTSPIQTQLDAKASLASPTFTGTATMDGLTVSANNPSLTVTDTSTNGSIVLNPDYFSGGADHIRSDTNSLYIGTDTAKQLAFKTNNTERLRIDSSGNVGIGTTSPATALDIDGDSSATTLTVRGGTSSLASIDLLGGTSGNDNSSIRSKWSLHLDCNSTGAISNRAIVFGNGATETARIDSSGNLLVGQTTTNNPAGANVAGAAIANNGFISVTRDGGFSANFNRKTSDGTIVQFNKDGTTVGSIGTYAGDLTIGDADIALRFDTGSGLVPWNMTTNAARDAALDIGAASVRFKDLHLSGTANVANISETVYALTGTALNASNGGIQTKTLAANTTFTDSLSSGDAIVLQLEAGASYTVTWPTMTWVTSGGNVAPTLTAKDTLVFWKVSSVLYGAYTGSYV